MNRNSPHDEAKTLPDFKDTDSPPDDNDDGESPKPRHESAISSAQEPCLLDMPTQLVNGSNAFRSQNRWLSGFQPPQSHSHSAYDGMYSPTTTTTTNGDDSPSFSTVNGMSSFDQHQHQHQHAVYPNSHMTGLADVSPSQSRPMSNHEAHFKQDARYCYD